MVLGPRFIWAQLCALVSQKVPIQGPLSRTFTVLPFVDCETGVTLNSARYLFFSDIVQLECNTRSGFTLAGLKNGMWAVTLSNTIFYRRAVRAFTRLTVTSELIGWDDRIWVWQNAFRNSKGQICAVGFAKVAGRSKKGLEPPTRGFQIVGQEAFLRPLHTDVEALFARLEEVAKRILAAD